MGNKTSSNDEWIELFNNTPSPVDLDGWILKAADGTPEIKMAGIIPANGFYLLERTDDDTVPNMPADQIYTGALGNIGEMLKLFDNLGGSIDSVDNNSGWLAGDNATKQTMARSGLNQWRSSQESGGTPKAQNTFAVDIVKTTVAFEDHPQLNTQGKGLATTESQATQKSLPLILIAGALAVFSGSIILILKKELK